MDRVRIAYYTHELLPFSTPYFLKVGESLRRYEPYYIGVRYRPDVPVPRERSAVLCPGSRRNRFQELLFYSLGVAPALGRAMDRWGIALIHAHFGPNAAAVLPFAKRKRLPLVITFHGYDATSQRPLFPRHRLYLHRRKRLIRYAARFLTVSDFLRTKLVRQGYPEDRIAVIPWGVDPKEFPYNPTLSMRKPTILTVARLVPVKGLITLLRAVEAVQKRVPGAVWKIIGHGPLEAHLEREIRARGIQAEMVGALPHSQVIREMAFARVLAVPSEPQPTGEEEGFGMVFLESMACGTPVIGTRTGGIPEVVEDGVSGLLVPPRDPVALAEALEKLLTDDSMWYAMSQAARRRVETQFALSRHIERLEKVYDEVLAEYGR